MALKFGYKETEIGAIPEEWEISTLGACLSERPSYWINAAAVPYSDRLPTYVRITDITDDGHLSAADLTSVQSTDADRYYLREGDIVFARTGASVGKSYRYDPRDGPLVFAGFLIRVHPDAQKLLPAFAGAYVTTGAYWNWVRLMSMRSGQPGISGREYAQLPVPLPPLAEQREIAAALGDVDALLEVLTRLIAKKRDLKQAAMQQLLTGQTRLSGFRSPWEERLLGSEVISLDAGVSVTSVDDEAALQSGDFAVLKTSSVQNGVFLPHECKKISVKDLHHAKLNPRVDSILVSRMNTIDLVGECGYIDVDYPRLFVPDRLWVTRFRPGSTVSARWLSYVLSTPQYRQLLKAIATGTSGSMKNISKESFLSLPITFPDNEEQAAIVAVFADMDAEIDVLEQRLSKTRALKRGMMQELLTGSKRLV